MQCDAISTRGADQSKALTFVLGQIAHMKQKGAEKAYPTDGNYDVLKRSHCTYLIFPYILSWLPYMTASHADAA